MCGCEFYVLPAAFLIAVPAGAQGSLVPFTSNVSLYACPGGLRQIIPINASVPTSFAVSHPAETWLQIGPSRRFGDTPQTPTWVTFATAGVTPGPPVDVTPTPADGSAPVVIHVAWNPAPDCNRSGNTNGTVTVTPPTLGLLDAASQPTPTVQTSSSAPVPFTVTATAPWISLDWASSYSTSTTAPATYVMCHSTTCHDTGLGGLGPGISGTYISPGGPVFFILPAVRMPIRASSRSMAPATDRARI